MNFDSPQALKRRRLTNIDPMDAEAAKTQRAISNLLGLELSLPIVDVERRYINYTMKFNTVTPMAKLEAAEEKYGREIRIFETRKTSETPAEIIVTEEPEEDFYEFTAEDYYRLQATKREEKFLKTRKFREAEEAARRSRMTKAVIRVRFPDNNTLEATFHPSESIQSLVDLLKKVVARPELPFYIYTTPPKKQIKDTLQDFYSAGFIPGAIVYFSYDVPKDDEAYSGPFLEEDLMSLKGLDFTHEPIEPIQPPSEAVTGDPSPAVQQQKSAEKKAIKPKWLKM
ncbi:Plant UBX domain-containing protein 1, variant 2 [Ancistrocladus abbreviatus]